MNDRKPVLSIDVDLANPGQFFACCGLLELAHRLWPGAEGWFERDKSSFHLQRPSPDECTIEHLLDELKKAGVDSEMSREERHELKDLESRRRTLKKGGKQLNSEDEQRRKWLGKQQREGALVCGSPFNLRVAWWLEDGDVPKTFAGQQKVLRMATAMMSEIDNAIQSRRILEYRCLLRSGESKVEPFYFDALRFANALDAGFSLDVQEKTIRATAAPVTELLALIGMQRFRPAVRASKAPGIKAVVDYVAWCVPLGLPPAGATVSGGVPLAGSRRFSFEIRARDDQKRYGAFGFAIPLEAES